MANNKTTITVENMVNVPVEKAWEIWTEPSHIIQWCRTSDDWEAPHAENDVREGGKFKTVMAAKDGSTSFDFTGTYTDVVPNERLEYAIDDGRKVTVEFKNMENKTKITETFETENINSEDQQRFGWQSILDNFKKYAEANQ
jgi:uncharacterized protein YndB with AHSA1/START domain